MNVVVNFFNWRHNLAASYDNTRKYDLINDDKDKYDANTWRYHLAASDDNIRQI